MTTIYLAYSGGDPSTMANHNWSDQPLSILVAMPFLKSAYKLSEEIGDRVGPEKWMLDSGAWSAFKSGAVVDIDALIEEANSPLWDECVGLDVIGSWEGSRDNLDYMRKAGCTSAMPVFHIGEPWHLLEYYCEHFEKVGLACSMIRGNGKSKKKFIEQCFAKGWPHKFHSFGWTMKSVLMEYPFHSADASSWATQSAHYNVMRQYSPDKMGRIQFKGASSGSMRGIIGGEISIFADLQSLVRAKWAKEIAKLD